MKAYVIETLIRYPKKFLGGVELMMKKLEEQDWAARIRGTALSERYRGNQTLCESQNMLSFASH